LREITFYKYEKNSSPIEAQFAHQPQSETQIYEQFKN